MQWISFVIELIVLNPVMNDGSSKSAKIVLSKSIFYVKNWRNFFKNKPESFQPSKASQTFQYFEK